MNLSAVFKKQGGFHLIKQYARGGALFTACAQFALLGKSKKALEILRLSAQFKIVKKLKKKFLKSLETFDASYVEQPHNKSDKVWVCWLQGLDSAPIIVKKCYESLQQNIKDKEIVLLTNENISDYVTFPAHILEKREKGIITPALFSDLLRLELLINHGGTWIDATVFCSGPDIPEYMLDSELFFFQCLKPGRDGHANTVSSWYISSHTNSKILMAVRHLLYEYLEKNNFVVDYFIFHDFLSIVLEFYEEDWIKIPPRDNATPHNLLLRFFEPYDEDVWNVITGQIPFHKLSHKLDPKLMELEGTYYKKIVENE